MNEHNIDMNLLASIKDGDHVVAEYEAYGAKIAVDGLVRSPRFPADAIYHGGEVLRRGDSAPSSTLRRIVSHTSKHDEPGDPIGSVVYVTGDTAHRRHHFPVGTEVTITRSDYDLDGEYCCDDAAGLSQWVHSADLDVEPPSATVADLDACGTWAVVTDGFGTLIKREDGTWGAWTAERLVKHLSPLTIRHRGVQA